MSARVDWDGLDELKAALRRLPEELTDESQGIVVDAAEAARAAAAAAYPRGDTGNLQSGLKVDRIEVNKFGAGARLRNTSPHAHLFENGTQTRHTALGANRGVMPAKHVFVPAAIRARTAMYGRLIDLLEAHGLEVSGRA